MQESPLRTKLLILLSALLLVVLTGALGALRGRAGEGPREAREIRLALGAMPQTLDWSTSSAPNDANYPLIQAMMRGLTRLDERFEAAPDLAEHWDIGFPEGRTGRMVITFHLRKDVVWSDGRTPLVARDFVVGWRRAALGFDPGEMEELEGAPELMAARASNPAMDAARLQPLLERLGVQALDDHTLRVTLRSPATYFLQRLAYVYVFYPVPSADLEGLDPRQARDYFDDPRNGKPMVLGAYAPERWDRLRRLIRLARNPHASPRPGAPEHVTVYQSSLASLLYDHGKADFLLVQDPRQVWSPAPDQHQRPLNSVGWLGFDTRRVPLELREAIACAIDRRALMRDLEPDPRPAFGLLPHDMSMPGAVGPGDPRAAAFPVHDPARARAHLRALGPWKERLILLVHKESVLPEEEMARGIQRQLRPYGLELEVLASAQFNKDLQTLRPPLFIRRNGADFNHPQTFLVSHTRAGSNGPSWQDLEGGRAIQEYEALLREGAAEADPERMADLYTRAQALLLSRHCVLVPLCYPRRHFRRKPWVEGLEIDPFNFMDLKSIQIRRG